MTSAKRPYKPLPGDMVDFRSTEMNSRSLLAAPGDYKNRVCWLSSLSLDTEMMVIAVSDKHWYDWICVLSTDLQTFGWVINNCVLKKNTD